MWRRLLNTGAAGRGRLLVVPRRAACAGRAAVACHAGAWTHARGLVVAATGASDAVQLGHPVALGLLGGPTQAPAVISAWPSGGGVRSATSAAAPAEAAATRPAAQAAKQAGGKAKGAGAASTSQPAATPLPSPEELRAQYQRSRFQEFFMRCLSRELMLKLNLKSVHDLPRVRHVSVAVQAKDVLGQQHVDKWQMLLHALGLEYMSGQPAEYAVSKLKYYRRRGAVAGVHIKLHGQQAYDLLEKLVYVVLPSQSAFEGLLVRSVDRAGHLHFRVSRMSNFPDFEEMFETFEGLGGMHVNVVMDNVARRPHRSHLLLTGLQVPLFTRRRRLDGRDAEEAAAEASAAAAGEQQPEAGDST